MTAINSFHAIIEQAHKHHPDLNVASLQRPKTPRSLKAISADRWLAESTKALFQSGFSWQVIESKWPHFERVFGQFDVARWAAATAIDIDDLLTQKDIVRNRAKIEAVLKNAHWFHELLKDHNSIGEYFAQWSIAQYCNNLVSFQQQTARLGGKTGQVFLRRMGVDTLVFTPDVISALTELGIVNNKPPNSKTAWQQLQNTINAWHQESELSLTEISQLLALSRG